jgi:ATP-binding cassette subfamily F protein 3
MKIKSIKLINYRGAVSLNIDFHRQLNVFIGVNGAGKSTLLKIMSGQTESSNGKCEIGASVSVGYFSQFSLEVLDPKKTVIEELRGRVKEKNDGYLRNLLAAFLFRGDDVEKKISVLSGGEKSRLILAGLMSQNHNLLILDEPTNHLDLASREVLLKALKEFEGTVIMVSHDRYFLRELSTKVLEVSKGGVLYFPGDFDYYLEKKKA